MSPADVMTPDTTPSLEAAEAYAQRHDLPAARAAFQRALETLGEAPGPRVRALGGLSWTLCMLGEAEAARQAAQQALDIQTAKDPAAAASLAILHGFAGNALMALGRFDDALEHYRTTLAQQKAIRAPALERANTCSLIGEAAGRLGHFQVAMVYQREALAALRASLTERDPQLAFALTNLGVSLYRLDQPDEAEQVLREALAIDPDLMLATENLIHVLYKQDRREEGRTLAESRYRGRSFVAQPPPANARGTLLLLWALDGTVPHAHLLAGLPLALIDWHIEFAAPEHEAGLPAYDLVLNLIGDADPGQGDRALASAIDFQSRCPARMLNDPRLVQRTRRHDIAERLAGIEGLVIPHVVQLDASALRHGAPKTALQAQGLSLPVLLRDAGMHGGQSVQLLSDAEALGKAVASLDEDATVYATAYHDYAAPDGFFRKYRAIFVDRVPYPYHLAISPHWLVHYFSAEMEEHAWKQEEELRYLSHMPQALGERATAVLHEIGRRMDLDYCGIDFSLLPDGRVLLFECNATMLVHPEPEDGPYARKNPHIRRIISTFQEHLLRATQTQNPSPALAGEGGARREAVGG